MAREETIKNLLTELIEMIDNGSQKDLDRADEIATIIIKALEQEPKSEWILVSERLPEEKGCYLATIQGFDYHTFIKVVNFTTNLSLVDKYDFKDKEWAGWYDCSEYGYYEMDDVIAWQLLPEPYTESEE